MTEPEVTEPATPVEGQLSIDDVMPLDTPEETDDRPFFQVALRMTVQADDEGDAVDEFIEQINTRGLRQWIFDVMNRDEGEAPLFFNGFGGDVTDQMLRAIETGGAEGDTDEPAPPAEGAGSDADLLALAAKLNEE